MPLVTSQSKRHFFWENILLHQSCFGSKIFILKSKIIVSVVLVEQLFSIMEQCYIYNKTILVYRSVPIFFVKKLLTAYPFFISETKLLL